MIVGVDFDGTIVRHKYPRIGEPIPGAISVMKELLANKHDIILWTMRSGPELNDALSYLLFNGIKPLGVNTNPTQIKWTKSPKAYCHLYIDDAGLGCPLSYDKKDERPYVCWSEVRELLVKLGYLKI